MTMVSLIPPPHHSSILLKWSWIVVICHLMICYQAKALCDQVSDVQYLTTDVRYLNPIRWSLFHLTVLNVSNFVKMSANQIMLIKQSLKVPVTESVMQTTATQFQYLDTSNGHFSTRQCVSYSAKITKCQTIVLKNITRVHSLTGCVPIQPTTFINVQPSHMNVQCSSPWRKQASFCFRPMLTW